MSPTMHVICLKDTGHIVAALAITTPGDPPELDALVGSDLPVANLRSTENNTETLGQARTRIPASLLELKSVPLDENVIATPMHHAIDGGRIVRLPLGASPPPQTLLNAQAVTLNGGTPNTKGLAIVAHAGDPTDQVRVQSGKFVDTNADNVSDPLILALQILPDDTHAEIKSPGNYDIFVALEGRQPYWAMVKIP